MLPGVTLEVIWGIVMRFIITVVLCCIFAAPSFARRANDEELSTAQSVIASYKELRKVCSVAKGQERKDCFRDLNEANEAYQQAKSLLSGEKEKRDITNLHMVSYVD